MGPKVRAATRFLRGGGRGRRHHDTPAGGSDPGLHRRGRRLGRHPHRADPAGAGGQRMTVSTRLFPDTYVDSVTQLVGDAGDARHRRGGLGQRRDGHPGERGDPARRRGSPDDDGRGRGQRLPPRRPGGRRGAGERRAGRGRADASSRPGPRPRTTRESEPAPMRRAPSGEQPGSQRRDRLGARRVRRARGAPGADGRPARAAVQRQRARRRGGRAQGTRPAARAAGHGAGRRDGAARRRRARLRQRRHARRPVGIVAAAGTGAQEAMRLLDRWGVGVIHVIGARRARPVRARSAGGWRWSAVARPARRPGHRGDPPRLQAAGTRGCAAPCCRRRGTTPMVAALIGLRAPAPPAPPVWWSTGTLEPGALATLRLLGVPGAGPRTGRWRPSVAAGPPAAGARADGGARALLRRHPLLRGAGGPRRARSGRSTPTRRCDQSLRAAAHPPGRTHVPRPRRGGVHRRPAAPDDRPGRRGSSSCASRRDDAERGRGPPRRRARRRRPRGSGRRARARVSRGDGRRRSAGRRLRPRHRAATRRATPRQRDTLRDAGCIVTETAARAAWPPPRSRRRREPGRGGPVSSASAPWAAAGRAGHLLDQAARRGRPHALARGGAASSRACRSRGRRLGDPAHGFFRPVARARTRWSPAPAPADTLEERVFASVDALERAWPRSAHRVRHLAHPGLHLGPGRGPGPRRRRAGPGRAHGAPRRRLHDARRWSTASASAILEPDRCWWSARTGGADSAPTTASTPQVVHNGVDAGRLAPLAPERAGRPAPPRSRRRRPVRLPRRRRHRAAQGQPCPGRGHGLRCRGSIDPAPALRRGGGHSFQDYTAYREDVLALIPRSASRSAGTSDPRHGHRRRAATRGTAAPTRWRSRP